MSAFYLRLQIEHFFELFQDLAFVRAGLPQEFREALDLPLQPPLKAGELGLSLLDLSNDELLLLRGQLQCSLMLHDQLGRKQVTL